VVAYGEPMSTKQQLLDGPKSHESRPIPEEFAPLLPPALRDVNVPAYVLDRDGTVRWLNDAAIEVTGDAVGKQVTSVVEMNRREARQIFERNLESGAPSDHLVRIRRPDGSAITVEVSSVPLGPDHHAVGMFGLAIPTVRPRAEWRRGGPLTRRQHEVLVELAQGASTDVIATRLFLSRETVRNHVRQILRRLDTTSRLEAVAVARRNGLV
jgi:PAS domain S-box-containing protein